MAFDGAWWRQYKAEVDEVFKGERLTCSSVGKSFGVPTLHQQPWFQVTGNSGTAAIQLAVVGGASKVVMLGYDCQRTGGKTHWHGDHPKTLGNARSIANWPQQFKSLARRCGGKVVNCSRVTALDCFPRMELSEAL